MLSGPYPNRPLSAVPAVLLEAFHAERELDEIEADALDDPATQRAYALYEGAQRRALVCGGLRGHAEQAAAMLVLLNDLDVLLGGGLTLGGADGLRRKLDNDEMGPLITVRETLVRLLDWHMREGGGALMPIAKYQGLVWKDAA